MAAKTTRAERRAASREKIAKQRADKEAYALEQQEAANKRNTRKNILIFCTLLVTMPLLALGITLAGDSVSEHHRTLNELLVANYEIQDSEKIRDTSFSGDDVMVTTSGKMYECRGLHLDDIKAKKPLTCDGITLQPKP